MKTIPHLCGTRQRGEEKVPNANRPKRACQTSAPRGAGASASLLRSRVGRRNRQPLGNCQGDRAKLHRCDARRDQGLEPGLPPDLGLAASRGDAGRLVRAHPAPRGLLLWRLSVRGLPGLAREKSGVRDCRVTYRPSVPPERPRLCGGSLARPRHAAEIKLASHVACRSKRARY